MHKRSHTVHVCTDVTDIPNQPADDFPSTACQRCRCLFNRLTNYAVSVLNCVLKQGLETVFKRDACSPQTRFNGETPDRSSCHLEAEFLLHIWCHISQEEIDTATFLSCCRPLFSSRLYIYLMSAGNPLSLKVCVSSANSGPVCLKRKKYISKGQLAVD